MDTRINPKTGKPKIASRGGARAGAGRPKGSTDKVTIAGLLDAIYVQSGKPYVEVLAEDFHQAKLNKDNHLVQKYHTLILNKVAASLAAVEVTDTVDTIEAKRQAFAEAIAAIAGVRTK